MTPNNYVFIKADTILPLVYNNVQSSLLTTLFFVFRSGFSESILPLFFYLLVKSSWSCLNWPEWVVYGYSLELSLSRSTSSQLAREHVTNIDGEVESWRPATNIQIWKGGSMHMKHFVGSGEQRIVFSVLSSNNLHTVADDSELLTYLYYSSGPNNP